ncbi:hypothetical protein [Deinococcus alpinitundrae]|uniref:hypothetical protein n=1 Tax=Deinococcus alpinitundrae TaxID=468913 RepID=UPI0013799C2D|nr:hypothetical protein [Deinococcus alpinitundrae]
MTDAEPLLTPAQVSQALGVGASTLRRHALMYETLFGPLPRERDQRRWPIEAVRRLQAAQQALTGGLVGSLETALTMVRDGQPLPEPVEVPEDLVPVPDLTPSPDLYLVVVVDELRSLRALVETQSAELVALRGEVQALRALPATTTSVTPPQAVQELESSSTRALLEAVSVLQDQVRAQGEREGDRLRVMLHAVAAHTTPEPEQRPVVRWWQRLFGG